MRVVFGKTGREEEGWELVEGIGKDRRGFEGGLVDLDEVGGRRRSAMAFSGTLRDLGGGLLGLR